MLQVNRKWMFLFLLGINSPFQTNVGEQDGRVRCQTTREKLYGCLERQQQLNFVQIIKRTIICDLYFPRTVAQLNAWYILHWCRKSVTVFTFLGNSLKIKFPYIIWKPSSHCVLCYLLTGPRQFHSSVVIWRPLLNVREGPGFKTKSIVSAVVDNSLTITMH